MKTIINRLQQFPRILFTIALFSILAACGGGSSSSTPPTAPVDPTDASLSSLVPSASSLSPKFASGILQYELLTDQEKITVTSTVSQATATVKVNDTATKSGEASQSIDLTVGENIITLIVTAADGKTTKTYKITVTRIDLTTNASLRSLTLSSGTLSPDFSSKVTDYTVTITAETIAFTPTVDFNTATVKVNDTATKSGEASQSIDLNPGENTITLIVTAANKSTTKTYSIKVKRIANVEFTNPKAADAANHKFGEKVVQLSNGNIVVHAPGYGTDKGAVHFYKPTSNTAVASFYGTNAGDKVGSGGIIALANDNFLIVSPSEDKGTIGGAGSVRLVNGTTGNLIKTITGNSASDFLANKGITLLNDNQFVITSYEYQNNAQRAGLVQVIDDQGNTIKTLYGDELNVTYLGDQSVTALSNNNFVIVSSQYTHNGQANAGKVLLVNSKGEVLKSITGQGKKIGEAFGGSGITPLKNGNFLIATRSYDASEGTTDLNNAGAIELINGSTGAFISRLVGDKKDGYLGYTKGGNLATTTITTLANSNYVVMHHTADNGATQNAGSVRLFSGVDGNEIIFPSTATATGTPLFGNATDDFKKDTDINLTAKITALKNSNYVVTAPYSREIDNISNTSVDAAGSIRLMNGFSGQQIGIKEGKNGDNGDEPNTWSGFPDYLGSGHVIELSNGKFVVVSTREANSRMFFAGSVRVFDDKFNITGLWRGTKSSGYFGINGLTALGNNHFVISSPNEDYNDIADNGGKIDLINANNTNNANDQELKKLFGDDDDDNLSSGGVTPLNNHNFVFASPLDDVGGIADLGSVQVMNGTTGAEGNKIVGTKAGDMKSAQMIKPATGDYFILSQPLADDNDKVDVGKVSLVVSTF